MVSPIPAGQHSITPHLSFKDAAKAIDLYKKIFGAQEIHRMHAPDGKIMHADLKIGDAHIFICDEFENCGMNKDAEGNDVKVVKMQGVTIHLFVEDCDKTFKQAVDAGAQVHMPPMDAFWGDRYARVIDPFGQPWSIATHKEDLSPEQMQERMKEAFKQMAGAAK